MIKAFSAAVLAIVGLFVLFALLITSGCSQPAPKPTPVQADAGVVDMFSGKVWNCRLPVVDVERDSAVGDVRACLTIATDVNACAVKQATTNYQPVSVACVLRDVGARCNAAWLAGATDPAEKTCADAARSWVADHHLGYISVEASQ